MAEKKHAILSASGSTRWLNCTPSARLEEQFEEGETSVFAEEGTLAHDLGELELRLFFKEISKVKYNKELKKIKAHELYSNEMPDYVDVYTGYVIERYNEAKVKTGDPVISIEQRLDFSHVVPEGFGTGDAVIIADGVLEITDLKYGKGVPVYSENNSQMMLYALGAVNEYDFLYDIKEVRMTIAQPRLDSLSSWQISVEELNTWGEEYVKPRAEMAWAGEGEFVPGDHCQFCRARFTCRARAEMNLELAKHDFANAELLGDEDVSEILEQAKHFKNWIKDIEQYALDQALEGKKWPGFKVVEGRSNRKYSDDLAVANRLIENNYDEAALYEKKLYGITKMAKIIGKSEFDNLLSDLIIKPQGKPALAPEDDKRPEFNSAAEDFKD